MNIKNSLRLLQIEMVLTVTLLSTPIMVPFYNSIGMDQGQIGLSQALFTIALLAVNIPTGWIADRFSRKFCNAFGDLGCALALVLYSQAQDFTQVVLVEVMFGIAMAFTQGADSGLFHAYSYRLDATGALLARLTARLNTWQPIAQAVALLVGGYIGTGDYRLAIGLSAIPYVIGCMLSLIIKEEGQRLIAEHRNPLRDMVRVTHSAVVRDVHLRWLIIAYAVGREITHPMVWALTPLLILAGVPLEIVAVGWIINMGANVIGARLAARWSLRLPQWQRFMFPIVLVVIALSVMSIHLSISTIWLYALLGISQGWSAAVLMPMVQQQSPHDIQSTVSSIAKSASQLLYIPLVWVINAAGVIDMRLTMVATIIVFVPLAAVTAWRLYCLERK